MGAMFMKTLAAQILNRLGFRRVLVVNGILASAMLCACGLFRPETSHIVIIATLLVSGFFRSLQFTSLNAISYAEVEQKQMGHATSLAGMMQQLSLSLGVAIGGYLLQIVGLLNGRPATDVHNFYVAFVGVGLISASSVLDDVAAATQCGRGDVRPRPSRARGDGAEAGPAAGYVIAPSVCRSAGFRGRRTRAAPGPA